MTYEQVCTMSYYAAIWFFTFYVFLQCTFLPEMRSLHLAFDLEITVTQRIIKSSKKPLFDRKLPLSRKWVVEGESLYKFKSIKNIKTYIFLCFFEKKVFNKSGDFRVTHQATANRSLSTHMVFVIARLCFCEGRTDGRTPWVKIMTTYSAVALVG